MTSRQINDDKYDCWFWGESLQSPRAKFMSITQESAYKCDLVEQCQLINEWNGQQFNKKAEVKLRNKINAKKSRERKKVQFERISKKIVDLQNQNIQLKDKKQCKWCKKPYDSSLIHNKKTHQIQIQELNEKLCKTFQFYPKSTLGFQNSNLTQNQHNYGKLWIAIAILMLIIGVKIYGLSSQQHLKGLDRILICKKQAQSWFQKFKDDNRTTINKNNHSDDYFSMKLVFQQKNKEQQNQKLKNKEKNLPKIQMQDEEKIIESKKVEEFKIHKQLIVSIEAEIAEIGRYV